MIPQRIQQLAETLRSARDKAETAGHDVSRTTIGVNPFGESPQLKLVDDSGAYWYTVGSLTGRLIRECVGIPSQATAAVALLEMIDRSTDPKPSI